MKEALYYEKLEGKKVHCRLCPNECIIADGKIGACGVRINDGGSLSTLVYGRMTSMALDPIEKKPLYHYHPGEYILSVGTKGCNFHCSFCQNWQISQDLGAPTDEITPDEIVGKAREARSFGIAYTYNEPFIWFEFVLDTARLAREKGLENVLVTNGYVNLEPLEELLPFIDAMNIDLKSIDEAFYRNICKGSLGPVLEVIKRSARSCHIELTNLVIPGLNDSEESAARLVDWVCDNLGPEVPLHFSRYFPCYQMRIPSTPIETMKRIEAIAKKRLRYVYMGNM
ncbi:MAG: AmmeMemoRadiSam system radical SAM enzyme [bacterium]|nr:AmmeMemoRadiSam system radical SAM enzyme [bacterium]